MTVFPGPRAQGPANSVARDADGQLEQALGADGALAAMRRTATFVIRVADRQQPFSARGQLVSGRYFSTLDIPITRGRALGEADVENATSTVAVVISDGLWRRAFAGAEDAVGRALIVSGVTVTIVGIAPSDFGGAWTDAPADLWLPLSAQHALHYPAVTLRAD